jgi:hypothetical protein
LLPFRAGIAFEPLRPFLSLLTTFSFFSGRPGRSDRAICTCYTGRTCFSLQSLRSFWPLVATLPLQTDRTRRSLTAFRAGIAFDAQTWLALQTSLTRLTGRTWRSLTAFRTRIAFDAQTGLTPRTLLTNRAGRTRRSLPPHDADRPTLPHSATLASRPELAAGSGRTHRARLAARSLRPSQAAQTEWPDLARVALVPFVSLVPACSGRTHSPTRTGDSLITISAGKPARAARADRATFALLAALAGLTVAQ